METNESKTAFTRCKLRHTSFSFTCESMQTSVISPQTTRGAGAPDDTSNYQSPEFMRTTNNRAPLLIYERILRTTKVAGKKTLLVLVRRYIIACVTHLQCNRRDSSARREKNSKT